MARESWSARASSPARGTPFIYIRKMAFSSTVIQSSPQPLGPTLDKNSPSCASKLMLARACTRPAREAKPTAKSSAFVHAREYPVLMNEY